MSVQGGAHGVEYSKLMGEMQNNYIRYQSVISRKALAYLLVVILNDLEFNICVPICFKRVCKQLNMQLDLIKESFWHLMTI